AEAVLGYPLLRRPDQRSGGDRRPRRIRDPAVRGRQQAAIAARRADGHPAGPRDAMKAFYLVLCFPLLAGVGFGVARSLLSAMYRQRASMVLARELGGVHRLSF